MTLLLIITHHAYKVEKNLVPTHKKLYLVEGKESCHIVRQLVRWPIGAECGVGSGEGSAE